MFPLFGVRKASPQDTSFWLNNLSLLLSTHLRKSGTKQRKIGSLLLWESEFTVREKVWEESFIQLFNSFWVFFQIISQPVIDKLIFPSAWAMAKNEWYFLCFSFCGSVYFYMCRDNVSILEAKSSEAPQGWKTLCPVILSQTWCFRRFLLLSYNNSMHSRCICNTCMQYQAILHIIVAMLVDSPSFPIPPEYWVDREISPVWYWSADNSTTIFFFLGHQGHKMSFLSKWLTRRRRSTDRQTINKLRA